MRNDDSLTRSRIMCFLAGRSTTARTTSMKVGVAGTKKGGGSSRGAAIHGNFGHLTDAVLCVSALVFVQYGVGMVCVPLEPWN